jgi:Arc/MetJ-type ribon-helix-helix transcriptional regulator
MAQLKKTTIRLSDDDEKLLDQLSKVLAYKFGKAENVSHSDVIRYSLRLTAARELGVANPETQVEENG